MNTHILLREHRSGGPTLKSCGCLATQEGGRDKEPSVTPRAALSAGGTLRPGYSPIHPADPRGPGALRGAEEPTLDEGVSGPRVSSCLRVGDSPRDGEMGGGGGDVP